MKFLKWLGIIVGIIIAAFLLITAFLPSDYHIERSATVKSSPEMAYNYISDFNSWENWSVWREMDPGAEYTITGKGEVGSKMAWKGEVSGTGELEIIDGTPGKELKMKLRFIEPWQMTSINTFTFEETEGGTKITWSDAGELGFIYRWFGLGMDDMMGPQFDSNLVNIKQQLEAMPMEASTREIAVVDFPGTKYYGIRIETTIDMAAMQQAYETSYGKIGQFLGVNGMQPTGAPISIMEAWEPENNKAVFHPAMTVAATDAKGNEEIVAGEIPACKVVRCIHKGPYGEMEASWNAAMKYVTDNGMEMAGMPWEQYISDPGEVSEKDLITHIYVPVK